MLIHSTSKSMEKKFTFKRIVQLTLHILSHLYDLFKSVKCVKDHIETGEWDMEQHENIQKKGGS